ncbi:MAG TPA: DUF2147 domain-containing protein [Rubrivivax sp.]|nr:DUF2147 domain-containing protein [Pseudomonadota bacterium]MCW5638647.1 DUF2147 domain-containing protein [Rubrivivax sp.]HOW48967.1 DUF2147 domain-containing protein [Rubrivivax sp.]HRY89371.1 DUF2147 domain-containing protein [Rubrivivax sp.]HRZ62579.1 DUF2147 domain-containing protein [Rubrivivax sp.]
MTKTLIAAALALAAGVAAAQSTPAGLWKTIDDATKAEKSLVRITDAGGVYTGKIEKILTNKTDAKCTLCTDERKDQPVQGMTIVRNVKAAAGDDNLWDGGEILDPNDGKTYKVRMKLADGGKKLDVRGYIGAPLLGRTQTWIRVE